MKYLNDYKKMHENKTLFRGNSILKTIPKIIETIKNTGADANDLLDYGCGQATPYKNKLYVMWADKCPDLYDPAVERFSTKPDRVYSGVLCIDVLEHVPEDELDDTLSYLFTHAKKFVVLKISTQPAKKALLDGTNVHCTVKPIEWWISKISNFDNKIYTYIQFEGDNGIHTTVVLNDFNRL